MTGWSPVRTSLRKDPAVRAVIRSWRGLTGGPGLRDAQRRTLVACSGGADSSALAIALHAAGGGLVLGHVVHDLRSAGESLADRDATRALAERLGCPFVERAIRAGGLAGNAEANARRLRYAALREMAAEQGCQFVATAHHGDDLAETVLMRLMRGAGPSALGAIRESRKLGDRTLIRPMLGVTRVDAERICTLAGCGWAEDATNRDQTKLRAAVRARVLPVLRELSPTFARRLRRSSTLLVEAGELAKREGERIAAAAKPGPAGELVLDRRRCRGCGGLVLGEAIRALRHRMGGSARGGRLSWRVLRPIVRAVNGPEVRPRKFAVGPFVIVVRSRTLEMKAPGEGADAEAAN